jgi:hypothetical protein
MVISMPEMFRPEDVIGKSYHHGMLPYGGAVSLKTGKITLAVSKADQERVMAELRALE